MGTRLTPVVGIVNIELSITRKLRLVCPQYVAQNHWVLFRIDEHPLSDVCSVLQFPGLHVLVKLYVERIKIVALQNPPNGRLRHSSLRTHGAHIGMEMRGVLTFLSITAPFCRFLVNLPVSRSLYVRAVIVGFARVPGCQGCNNFEARFLFPSDAPIARTMFALSSKFRKHIRLRAPVEKLITACHVSPASLVADHRDVGSGMV